MFSTLSFRSRSQYQFHSHLGFRYVICSPLASGNPKISTSNLSSLTQISGHQLILSSSCGQIPHNTIALGPILKYLEQSAHHVPTTCLRHIRWRQDNLLYCPHFVCAKCPVNAHIWVNGTAHASCLISTEVMHVGTHFAVRRTPSLATAAIRSMFELWYDTQVFHSSVQ